jgi:transcriptional regulator with XRE-family HTH domain
MNKLTVFGKDVRMRLIEKNIKQYELARTIGTTKSFLSQILHGARPGKKYISLIATTLDMDLTKYAV